jgi:hypothetical protein
VWWLFLSSLLGGLGMLLGHWQSPLAVWVKASGVTVFMIGLFVWLMASGSRSGKSGDSWSGFDCENCDDGDRGGDGGGD